MIFTVTKVEGDKVTIDGNHQLAGKVLNFDIEVVNVRDATEDELNPKSCCGGGCGGCGGNCEGGCDSECGSDDCNCDGECSGGCGNCN